jgi:hypothetical protein
MKRVLSAFAIGTVLALAVPTTASAQPATDPAQPATPPLAAPIGQREELRQNGPSRIRLDIGALDPRVVTAQTPDLLVAGKITNTGDRPIDDISVRLQRGEALESEVKLREALAKTPRADSVNSGFVNVSDSIQPGQTVDFALNVPLRGGQGALRIDHPGVYPLLVNVNGTPAYGQQARLAAVSLLLPVLSVPGGAQAADPPRVPPKVTVLWPLVDDYPRMLQPAPSGHAVLTDDGLAESLSPGGRLFSLLDVVDSTLSGNNPALRALCFVIDPSLIDTVDEMTEDYLVRANGGQTVPGKGSAAARLWLDRLRELTYGQCVLTLPYADADLVALSRSGAVDLEQIATGGAETVRTILKPVQPLQNVYWPLDGTLDERTLADLTATSSATVLADETRLRRVTGTAPYALGSANANGNGQPNRIVPIDQLVSSSLLGASADGVTTPASVQNGVATLVFRAAFDNREEHSILVAPPRRWTAPPGELDVFLRTLSDLTDGAFADPLPLGSMLAAPETGTVGSLDYPEGDAIREINGSVMSTVTSVNAVVRDLLGAMQTDSAAQVQPEDMIAPLQYGLLHATSGSLRGREADSTAAIADVERGLAGLRGQITVVRPALPFSLASADSAVPVQITNGLPVAVTVRIAVGESAGLRPSLVPNQPISAFSGITRFIPAEVIRSGRFTVDIGLTTPSGATSLGESSRFELSSSSYGSVTLAITGTAAAALVLLFGRRMYRRFKMASSGAVEPGDAAPQDTAPLDTTERGTDERGLGQG